jgi:hypothetical protein
MNAATAIKATFGRDAVTVSAKANTSPAVTGRERGGGVAQ